VIRWHSFSCHHFVVSDVLCPRCEVKQQVFNIHCVHRKVSQKFCAVTLKVVHDFHQTWQVAAAINAAQ